LHDSVDELVTFEQFSELLRSIEASPFFLGNADELVAVGTALTGGPPHRSQRAELPHWAPTSGHNVKSICRPRVQDSDFWKPAYDQPIHAFPGKPVFLASAPKRTAPEPSNFCTERIEDAAIGGYRVVLVVSP